MEIGSGGSDGPMVICAWCSKLLELGRGPVSHGICPPCQEEYFPGVSGVSAALPAKAVARG